MNQDDLVGQLARERARADALEAQLGTCSAGLGHRQNGGSESISLRGLALAAAGTGFGLWHRHALQIRLGVRPRREGSMPEAQPVGQTFYLPRWNYFEPHRFVK